MINEFITYCRYEVYIGLSDQITLTEKVHSTEFKEYIFKYCSENKIDFSMREIKGGYNHNNGYTIENSVVITLIGEESARFLDIIDTIKQYLNTDTVLVTREYLEAVFI